MNARAFWLSALIAGAVMGLLANLPILNLINCFLCLWIWLGGALAVYLYRHFHPMGAPPTVGQAALLGIVAGLIAAVIGAFVFTATAAVSMPIMNSLARTFDIQGDLPFQGGNVGSMLATAGGFLILDLILYPLFGALGAMIAASLMRKPAPPTDLA
jgi:hypothetical protein